MENKPTIHSLIKEVVNELAPKFQSGLNSFINTPVVQQHLQQEKYLKDRDDRISRWESERDATSVELTYTYNDSNHTIKLTPDELGVENLREIEEWQLYDIDAIYRSILEKHDLLDWCPEYLIYRDLLKSHNITNIYFELYYQKYRF